MSSSFTKYSPLEHALFLRRFRIRPRKIEYSSRKEQFLRSFLLVVFICIVGWGFWTNSEKSMQKLKFEARVSDESGLLDQKSKIRLMQSMKEAEKEYGVKIYIKISKIPVISTDALPGTVFLGVCPNLKQNLLIMPEEWEQALGPDFVRKLRREGMLASFQSGKWEEALIFVLESMIKRFEEVASGSVSYTAD